MSQQLMKIAAALREAAADFGEDSSQRKVELLKSCRNIRLTQDKALLAYCESLQFMFVYHQDKRMVSLLLNEMRRVAAFLRSSEMKAAEINTGLPFRPIRTRFSLDFLNWLKGRRDLKVRLFAINESNITLNDALRLSLPSSERELTSAGMEQNELFEALRIPESDKLDFLLAQMEDIEARADVADFLFDGLNVEVEVLPQQKEVSKLWNRISFLGLFEHSDILRKFDHVELLNRPLPEALKLSATQKIEAIRVIRDAMLLNARETDPATYLNEDSLRIFELERGIAIAFFDMHAFRQLSYESYIGYTLFKNGFPVAYGGGWIFGQRSLFGINIFDAYRGGESGYIMCQLLRAYRKAFGIEYFEVEPYQYGADNPDGIKSGAFWFYYRYGFRPVDENLNKLAQSEAKKIASAKGYRSSEKTLLKFTESNIGLRLGNPQKLAVPDISEKITAMIKRSYGGNRQLAIECCMSDFAAQTGGMFFENEDQHRVFREVSLFAKAFRIEDMRRLTLLKEMVQMKPSDPYSYQELWRAFFAM